MCNRASSVWSVVPLLQRGRGGQEMRNVLQVATGTIVGDLCSDSAGAGRSCVRADESV